MRQKPSDELESCRKHDGPYASTSLFGMTGAFVVPSPSFVARNLGIISYDGSNWNHPSEAWEHVSVSIVQFPKNCPTWEEMNFVKQLFWEDEELVFQFHPPKSLLIDYSPQTGRKVLHLWRPTISQIPLPPRMTV